MIVKSGISNFSQTNEYTFIEGGLFRSTSNVGSGGAAVALLDDLTDVTITSASNNQVLRYDTVSSQWVNSSVSSIYSPSIASASVTGVASFGDDFVVSAVGAVGLTSNIVRTLNSLTGALTITANSASNMNVTVSGTNIFISLNVSSGTADPSGGTSGNIYLQYTV